MVCRGGQPLIERILADTAPHTRLAAGVLIGVLDETCTIGTIINISFINISGLAALGVGDVQFTFLNDAMFLTMWCFDKNIALRCFLKKPKHRAYDVMHISDVINDEFWKRK